MRVAADSRAACKYALLRFDTAAVTNGRSRLASSGLIWSHLAPLQVLRSSGNPGAWRGGGDAAARSTLLPEAWKLRDPSRNKAKCDARVGPVRIPAWTTTWLASPSYLKPCRWTTYHSPRQEISEVSSKSRDRPVGSVKRKRERSTRK